MQSHIAGLALEALRPHWDFVPHIRRGLLQTNYIAEAAGLIVARDMQTRFPFLQQNIAPQLVRMAEAYHRGKSRQGARAENSTQEQQDEAETDDTQQRGSDAEEDTQIDVRIVNCNLPHEEFCRALERALDFEEVDQPIIFENFGGAEVPMENLAMVQKVQTLCMTQITKKKQIINIGRLKIQLKKAIHRYHFYYSLHEDSSYEDLVEQGIVNQTTSDMSIVVRCNLQVFNTLGNVLYELGTPGYYLIFSHIVDYISQEFQKFSLDIKQFDVNLLCE